MTSLGKIDTPLIPVENEAIRHFQQALAGGTHWYIALLESIGIWTRVEETVGDNTNRYVIAGEAFDWLLLAERLCRTVERLLPEEELLPLLFHGAPPLQLDKEDFKRLIGQGKYLQYLNFFYGVTLEATLALAVQEEVFKEQRISGFSLKTDHDVEVYRRIYGAAEPALLRSFRKERDYQQTEFISLSELKEFTYWLFKYRIGHSDPSRVASDTKKALDYFRAQLVRASGKMVTP